MISDSHTMLKEYVAYIAAPRRIPISKISVTEGRDVGCVDTHLLNITVKDQIVSVLVYKSDLDRLLDGLSCDRLEFKIRAALSRVSLLQEP